MFDHVWEVYWPGYWPIKPLSVKEISWSSYPARVRDAPHVGRALARYLDEINSQSPRVRDVLFIAHSLGCRIVLETIEHLRIGNRLEVPGVCLMAAAVPTFMVSVGGSLRGAAEYAGKAYVLHSPADRVLRWAFRPGEFLATVRTSPLEAVGRFGNPKILWDRRHGNFHKYRSRPWRILYRPF